jgi:hypothetical protein
MDKPKGADSEMEWAERVHRAYLPELRDEGLLPPLEALGRIYPTFGYAFKEPVGGIEDLSPDTVEMGIGTYFDPPDEVVLAARAAAHLTHYRASQELMEAVARKFADENGIELANGHHTHRTRTGEPGGRRARY